MTFEKAADLRIGIGPIAHKHRHPLPCESVTHFGAVDRGGLVRLACQAPIGGEIKKDGPPFGTQRGKPRLARSEEHTSELKSLMRISYAVFCLKKTKQDEKEKDT